MLAELQVVVFIKSSVDLDRMAEGVFGALRTPAQAGASPELSERYYEATGLGFRATLFANRGEVLDPEFEDYAYTLEITSQFWCSELNPGELEGPLSEYFSRQLAFELNVETATEILVDTTEQSEIYEIRSYRRNPQFRLDQSPTTPKVFVIETRMVEEIFEETDGQEWEEYDDEEEEGEAEAEPGEEEPR